MGFPWTATGRSVVCASANHVCALIPAQIEVLAETGVSPDPQAVSSNKYKQILGIKELHLLSFFALIYVGTEVTVGGWSVTYVQDKRHGGANAGYISSGFFGGLMLGRVLLMWVNRKVNSRMQSLSRFFGC